MLLSGEYDRVHAAEYARRWANGRNPLFFNYTGLGGDCTNFVSQAVYAGSCVMNYTPTFGWYYISEADRSAAWTGVEFFYNFIVGNRGEGPFGAETNAGGLRLADVIQLGNSDGVYYHTLIVTGFTARDYLVSAHTDDALDRPLSTYEYSSARYIHIGGVRIDIPIGGSCFEKLINGEKI